jgi:chemotaxis protein methyltransferase CheR
MIGSINEKELSLLSEMIAEKTGLHFSSDRWPDLERGICSAAPDLGHADCTSFVQWLLNNSLSGPNLEILADHLTIGETYFFRDKATFDFLRETALPELIESRNNSDHHIKIWSAGCCTERSLITIAIILKN